MVTTRRGRQFNSMVQGDRDGHTGADRDAVLMNGEDALALGAVLVTHDAGFRHVAGLVGREDWAADL